jgi:sec-independent protein translocase protein TatA
VFDISPIQILIVLVIALLVFGPKRLPDLGRNLGASIRDFRGAISGDDDSSAGASTETRGARDETETELKRIIAESNDSGAVDGELSEPERIIAASNAGDAEPVARA